jgi:hypothetical protein
MSYNSMAQGTYANALYVQVDPATLANSLIYVAGSTVNSGGGALFVSQFSMTGTLNYVFTDNNLTNRNLGSPVAAKAVTVSGSNVVVGGTSNTGSAQYPFLAAYDTTTKSNTGLAYFNVGAVYADGSINGVAVDSTGEIVAVGQYDGGVKNSMVGRFTSPSFVSDAAFAVPDNAPFYSFPADNDTSFNAVVVDKASRNIYIAGSLIAPSKTVSNLYAVHVYPNGSTPTPESIVGSQNTSNLFGNAIAFDGHGHVVIAGYDSSTTHAVVARYSIASGTGVLSSDTTFGANATNTEELAGLFGPSDVANAIVSPADNTPFYSGDSDTGCSPDNRAFLVGTTSQSSPAAARIWLPN